MVLGVGHGPGGATPDGPGCPVCHATETHKCECGDRDYAAYLVEWQAAIHAGEYDEFDATCSYFIVDMIPGRTITDFVRRKAAA